MKKYVSSIFAIILIIFSIGFVSSSAIAAEELSVQETIDLPTTTSLFGEKTLNATTFGEFVVGPKKNFFVLPGPVSDTPVIKFTKNGEPKKIQAIEEGQEIADEFQSERPDDPSEIDFSSLKLNEAPERAISSAANDITLYPYKNLVFGAGSALHEITPVGEFVEKHYAVDSYDWEDRIRVIDVAVDANGNMYVATMEDEIRKISSDNGLVKTWDIDRESFDSDVPDFSSPRLVTTSEHLFALMGQTDKILKYDLSGNLVEAIELPDKEFGGSTTERNLDHIAATEDGNLIAHEGGIEKRIHVLSSSGNINRSYKIPQSISETGITALADIAIGPDGNLYTISTTRNPASSDSAQTNFITSADIGLGSQIEETNKENDQSESEEGNEGGDQANNTNERSTNGYWKAGATSSLSGQSSQDINALKRLVNSLMQLKALIGMQQN